MTALTHDARVPTQDAQPRRWLQRLTSSPLEIEGASMEPSLSAGALIWARHFPYLFSTPARGDLVVIRTPRLPHRLDLKRIIGLPGEDVSWNGGQVWIDGVLLEEPYAKISPRPPGDEVLERVRLGPREYFVAGDNRLYSQDSRSYGPIPRSAILANVL